MDVCSKTSKSNIQSSLFESRSVVDTIDLSFSRRRPPAHMRLKHHHLMLDRNHGGENDREGVGWDTIGAGGRALILGLLRLLDTSHFG